MTGTEEVASTWSSASLGVRAQKKLAGRLANSRLITKHLIADRASNVFDSLRDLLVECLPKEKADKIVKSMVKLSLKVGVLAKNGLLEGEKDIQRLENVQRHVHNLALALISFSRVAYSYDTNYLMDLSQTLREELAPLVVLQLSDKSTTRLSFLFDNLCSSETLDEMFKTDHEKKLKKLADDLEVLLDGRLI